MKPGLRAYWPQFVEVQMSADDENDDSQDDDGDFTADGDHNDNTSLELELYIIITCGIVLVLSFGSMAYMYKHKIYRWYNRYNCKHKRRKGAKESNASHSLETNLLTN